MNCNRSSILTIFAVLVISLSNFWIYQIYEYNFLIGELLVIETSLLFLSTLSVKSKAIPILIFIIFSILSSILLINHFDKSVFAISTVESIQIRERQNFYAPELEKVYKNRVGIYYFDNLRLYFGKISNNFFTALDLNVYFAPASLIDYGKYPLLLAPLFIIGFLLLLATIRMTLMIYCILALITSSFINLDSKLGPLLMFPFISLCIADGLIKIIDELKKRTLNKII